MKTVNKSQKPIARVFLSHTAKDRLYAHYLRAILEGEGQLAVYSTDSVLVGADLTTALHNLIEESDLFVAVLSPSSVETPSVLFELGAAWGLEKPMILAFTSKDVFAKIPIDLRRVNLIDIEGLEDTNKNRMIADLIVKAVNSALHFSEVATA